MMLDHKSIRSVITNVSGLARCFLSEINDPNCRTFRYVDRFYAQNEWTITKCFTMKLFLGRASFVQTYYENYFFVKPKDYM